MGFKIIEAPVYINWNGRSSVTFREIVRMARDTLAIFATTIMERIHTGVGHEFDSVQLEGH